MRQGREHTFLLRAFLLPLGFQFAMGGEKNKHLSVAGKVFSAQGLLALETASVTHSSLHSLQLYSTFVGGCCAPESYDTLPNR